MIDGTVAEWLGRGLQNLLQQFESARYLILKFKFPNVLSSEEEGFLRYWSDQRLRKKQFLRKFSIGLPIAVVIAGALIINLLSGWYKKADMVLRSNSSIFIVILIAIAAIVLFITIFSAHHKWDQNELHYKELLKKKENPS
jgi:hypothetical protein